MPITIQLNGEPRELAETESIDGLLATLGLDARMVAVEKNRLVVKRAAYPTTSINNGDEIEIVAFVGGG